MYENNLPVPIGVVLSFFPQRMFTFSTSKAQTLVLVVFSNPHLLVLYVLKVYQDRCCKSQFIMGLLS